MLIAAAIYLYIYFCQNFATLGKQSWPVTVEHGLPRPSPPRLSLKKWFTAGDPHLRSYLDRKLWNLLNFSKRHERTLVQASLGTGDLSTYLRSLVRSHSLFWSPCQEICRRPCQLGAYLCCRHAFSGSGDIKLIWFYRSSNEQQDESVSNASEEGLNF